MEIRPTLSLVRTPSRDARVSCETLSQGVEDAFSKHEGRCNNRSDTSEEDEKKKEEEEEQYSFDECYTPRRTSSYGHNFLVARSRHLLSCFHPKAATTQSPSNNNSNNLSSPRRGTGVVDSFMRWGSTRGLPPPSVPHSGPLNPNLHHGSVESTLPHSGPIMGPNNHNTLNSPRRRGGAAESFMRWGSSRGPPPSSIPYSGPLNPSLHHGGVGSAFSHSGPNMHHSTLPHSAPLMGQIIGHSTLPHSGPIMLNAGPIIGHSGPLKTHLSSKGHSNHFNIIPADIAGKKKPLGYDAEEPTSPEVTCIGRVRAKPKNQKPPRGNKGKGVPTERRGLFATKKTTSTDSLDSPRKGVGKPLKWRSFLHSKDPKREDATATASSMESLGKWVDDKSVDARVKGENDPTIITSTESLIKGNGGKSGEDYARVREREINPAKVTSMESLERANIGGKRGDVAREQGAENPSIVTSTERLEKGSTGGKRVGDAIVQGEINLTEVTSLENSEKGKAEAAANPPENALMLMRASSRRRDAMDYLGENSSPPLSNANDTNPTQTPCDPNPNLNMENAALWKRRAFAGLSALDIQTHRHKLDHRKPFST